MLTMILFIEGVVARQTTSPPGPFQWLNLPQQSTQTPGQTFLAQGWSLPRTLPEVWLVTLIEATKVEDDSGFLEIGTRTMVLFHRPDTFLLSQNSQDNGLAQNQQGSNQNIMDKQIAFVKSVYCIHQNFWTGTRAKRKHRISKVLPQ